LGLPQQNVVLPLVLVLCAGSRFKALAHYLISGEPDQVALSKASDDGKVHYDSTGYPKFLDLQGYPADAMPWGTLNAINLGTGEYLWKIPFGQYPELVAQGMPNTGSENYGGPVVTAGECSSSICSRNGRTELQRYRTVVRERPRSFFMMLLKSANMLSQMVTRLGIVWRRFRSRSHPSASVMKSFRENLACELFDEGQFWVDHRSAAFSISGRAILL
jgi:hypothetical protein